MKCRFRVCTLAYAKASLVPRPFERGRREKDLHAHAWILSPSPLERPGNEANAKACLGLQAPGEKPWEKDQKQSENASSWPCYHDGERDSNTVPHPLRATVKLIRPKPDQPYLRHRPCKLKDLTQTHSTIILHDICVYVYLATLQTYCSKISPSLALLCRVGANVPQRRL